MKYRVKRTDLLNLSTGELSLSPLDTALLEAPHACGAVALFLHGRQFNLIGKIEEGTGGTASALCKDVDGRLITVRAWPSAD